MRRLITNADDFGLTCGVNRGISEAHARGLLTSATLMATGAAFEDAVRTAGEHPNLSVGCHIVLVDGTPVSNSGRIPTLVSNSSASFRHKISSLAIGNMLGKIDEDEIEAEAMAQFRKIQSAGVTISHFDTHKHAHMLPAVLRALLRAAKQCGIPAVRNPFGPRRTFFTAELRFRPQLWKRYLQVNALRAYYPGFQSAVREAGLATPDGSLGVISTGSMDLATFRRILQSLPDGTWELVCHPGYNDEDLSRVTTRLRESRDQERRLLTSAAAREEVNRAAIELISYRDFVVRQT
ncbi:MAG TPA: ChbG/HpnK family deacetylase [Terriglobales bacterium]|nr:ChbG/HpnK family deacetylase [Terriglobales bacterium]